MTVGSVEKCAGGLLRFARNVKLGSSLRAKRSNPCKPNLMFIRHRDPDASGEAIHPVLTDDLFGTTNLLN
jgi:hypothetical protein